jgi:hypothetical protein
MASFARGLIPWPDGKPNPIGPGVEYAVRATGCVDCDAWQPALARLAVAVQRHGASATVADVIARHTSERARNEPVLGERCGACLRERVWLYRQGIEWPAPDVVVRYFLTALAKAA